MVLPSSAIFKAAYAERGELVDPDQSRVIEGFLKVGSDGLAVEIVWVNASIENEILGFGI